MPHSAFSLAQINHPKLNLGAESEKTKLKFLPSSLGSWQVQFRLWERKFDSGLQFSKPVCDFGALIGPEKDKSSQAAAPPEDTAFAMRFKVGTQKMLQTLPFPHQPPGLWLWGKWCPEGLSVVVNMAILTHLRLRLYPRQSCAEHVTSLKKVVAGRLACGVISAALFYFVKGHSLPIEHLFCCATSCLCLLSCNTTDSASLEKNKGPRAEKAQNAKKLMKVELLWSTS